MPFFTSDLNLAEVTADPKPKQYYQPQAGLSPLQGAGGGSITGDPLSQLAQAFGDGSNGQAPSWLDNNTTGNLNLGGTIGGSLAGTPAPIIGGGPQGTMLSNASGGDSDYGYGDAFEGLLTGDSYQSLQDYLNAGSMEKGVLNSVLGMMGVPSWLVEAGHGINPLPDFLVPEGSQTMDWYQGETDYFGNPLSSAQAGSSGGFGDSYGSYYNQAEQDAVDMFDWGSDEHFDAIEESFDYGDTGGGFDSSNSGETDSFGGSISNDTFDNDDDAGGWSW